MKKLLLFVLLSCALPVASETISAVTFNPTRMGNYEKLRISRKAVFRGGLHVNNSPGINDSFFKVNSGNNSTITMKNDTTTTPIRRYYFDTITGVWWDRSNGRFFAVNPSDKETINMPDATFVGYDEQVQEEGLRPVYEHSEWAGLPLPEDRISAPLGGPLINANEYGSSCPNCYPIVDYLVTNGGRFGFNGVGSGGDEYAPSYIGNLRTKSALNYVYPTSLPNLGVGGFYTRPTKSNNESAAQSLLIGANKLIIRPYNYSTPNNDWAYLHVRGTTDTYASLTSPSNMWFLKKDLNANSNFSGQENMSYDYTTTTSAFKLAGFDIPFPGPGSVAQYKEFKYATGSSAHRETAYYVEEESSPNTWFLDPTLVVDSDGEKLVEDLYGVPAVHNTCFFQWIERMTSGSDPNHGGETVFVLGLGPCVAKQKTSHVTGYQGVINGSCGYSDCFDVWEPW